MVSARRGQITHMVKNPHRFAPSLQLSSFLSGIRPDEIRSRMSTPIDNITDGNDAQVECCVCVCVHKDWMARLPIV